MRGIAIRRLLLLRGILASRMMWDKECQASRMISVAVGPCHMTEG